MATHPPASTDLGFRLRRWLGLDDIEADEEDPSLHEEPAPREGLMARIERFLDELDIDVCASALAIAHDCVTGANPQLALEIEKRRRDGGQISLSWLEQAARSTTNDHHMVTVATLIDRLADGLDEFDRSTLSAREAAQDYKDALHRHVDDLERVGLSDTTIAEFLTIGRAMMSRTLQIETRLRRSEERARELQQKLEETRRLADLDHLTKLPNRRAFDRLYSQQYTEARAQNDHLCVAFCDIDHFKVINDTHGHAAGDRVLRTVAGMLAASSNETCHVARHGGEEFAVLFRGLALAEAYARLDSLREELAARRMVNRATDQPFGTITMSAGIADALAWTDRSAALKAADDALYAAKQSGRNRVVAAGRPARKRAAA